LSDTHCAPDTQHRGHGRHAIFTDLTARIGHRRHDALGALVTFTVPELRRLLAWPI